MRGGGRPDHYEVLGITRDASQDDVRRAYKRQALQWHPDKHIDPEKKVIAEERFKIVADAYEVLSNDEARAQYDRYGHDGPSAGPWGRGTTGAGQRYHDPRDVFREVFGEAFMREFFQPSPFMAAAHMMHGRGQFGSPLDSFFGGGGIDNVFAGMGMSDPFAHPFFAGDAAGTQHGAPWGSGMDIQPAGPSGAPVPFGFGGSLFGRPLFGDLGGMSTGASRSVRTVIRNGEKTVITTERDGSGNETVTVEVNGQTVERTTRPIGSG